MRCKKAKILLSVQLDEQLSERDALALERHLTTCKSCAQEKAEFSALRETMHLWADEEPSEWLAQSFSLKLKDLQQEPQVVTQRRPRRLVLGSAAAGFAAIAVVVVLLLHGQITQPPKLPQEPVAQVQPADNVKPPVLKDINPPIVAEVKPHPKMLGSKKPVIKPQRIAFNPHRRRIVSLRGHRRYPLMASNSYFNKPEFRELTSRSGSQNREEARRLMEKTLDAANNTRGEAAITVASNLGEASVAMGETLESVRGTLRKAADVLASESPARPNDAINYNGSTILSHRLRAQGMR